MTCYISLAGSCAIAEQLRRYDLRKYSLPLDWIRVLEPNLLVELLETNFKCMFDICDYTLMRKFVNANGKSAATYRHNRGVILTHAFKDDIYKEFDEFKKIFSRRVARFYDILKKQENIVFIRVNDAQYVSTDKTVKIMECLNRLCTHPFKFTYIVNDPKKHFVAPQIPGVKFYVNTKKTKWWFPEINWIRDIFTYHHNEPTSWSLTSKVDANLYKTLWKHDIQRDISLNKNRNRGIADLRLLSWNVHGIKDVDGYKNNQYLEIIKNFNPDLVCLQEMICPDIDKDVLIKTYPYRIVAGFPSYEDPQAIFGLAIYSKFPFVQHQTSTDNNFLLTGTIYYSGCKVRIYNTHLNHEHDKQHIRNRQMQEIMAIMDYNDGYSNSDDVFPFSNLEDKKHITILSGDFNQPDLYFNPEWIRSNNRGSTIDNYLLEYLDRCDFRSVFECHPRYTTWTGRTVDYIFSKGMPDNAKIRQAFVHYTDASDHLPLFVDLNVRLNITNEVDIQKLCKKMVASPSFKIEVDHMSIPERMIHYGFFPIPENNVYQIWGNSLVDANFYITSQYKDLLQNKKNDLFNLCVPKIDFSKHKYWEYRSEDYIHKNPFYKLDSELLKYYLPNVKHDMNYLMSPKSVKFGNSIPVLRYSTSKWGGLFYDSTDKMPNHGTYYFIEPKSDVELTYNKSITVKNKFDFFMQHRHLLEHHELAYVTRLYSSYKYMIDYLEGKFPENMMMTIQEILNYDPKMLRDKNLENINLDEKYYVGRYFGLAGSEDILDETVYKLGKLLGLDIIIFTHMIADLGIKQEVLDLRPRSISLDNLHKR